MAKNVYELTEEELESLSVEELEAMLIELEHDSQDRGNDEYTAEQQASRDSMWIEKAEKEMEKMKLAGAKLETDAEKENRLANELEEARRAEIVKERIKRNLLRRERRKENEENRQKNIEKRQLESEQRALEEEKRKKEEEQRRKTLIGMLKSQREHVKEQEESILQLHEESQERNQKIAHYRELIQNGKESLVIDELEKMRVDDIELYKTCMEEALVGKKITDYFGKKYHDFSIEYKFDDYGDKVQAMHIRPVDVVRLGDILRQKYPDVYKNYIEQRAQDFETQPHFKDSTAEHEYMDFINEVKEKYPEVIRDLQVQYDSQRYYDLDDDWGFDR